MGFNVLNAKGLKLLLPYVSGRAALKFLLWCELLALIHDLFKGVTFGVAAVIGFIYDNPRPLIQRIGALILGAYVFLLHPYLLYLLQQGILKSSQRGWERKLFRDIYKKNRLVDKLIPVKMSSKRYLRSYYLMKIILFLPLIILVVLTKRTPFWERSGSNIRMLNHYLEIFHLAFYIGHTYLIYKYHNKLDSPLLAELLETLRWQTFTKDEIQGIMPKLGELNRSSGAEFSIPQCTLDKFRDYIISPLNVVIYDKEVLGEGNFGTVCKGLFITNHERIPIAVKTIKNPEQHLSTLVNEIKIMILAGEHKNIVKFYGITSDASIRRNLSIVTELCYGGNLYDYVKNQKRNFSVMEPEHSTSIVIEDFGRHCICRLERFAFDIATGMEHLASKKIVHGDLSIDNVLLGPNLTPKIADFGISRNLYNYQMYAKGDPKDTIAWKRMAIEVLEDLKFSEKSDVWSFGVVLWETFTFGNLPFPDHGKWTPEFPKLIRMGMRLENPEHASEKINQIMKMCWELNHELRPKFADLKLELHHSSSKDTGTSSNV